MSLTDQYASDSDGGGVRYFDDFIFGAAANVERVTWRGTFQGSSALQFPMQFDLRFYPTSGSLPNESSPLSITSVQFNAAGEITNTGILSIGETVYEFTADIAPVTLAAGTRYWFSPQDVGNLDFDPFYWSTSGVNGASARKIGVSSLAAATSGDHYFILEGTVPEPAGLGALATALALLSRRRRTP